MDKSKFPTIKQPDPLSPSALEAGVDELRAGLRRVSPGVIARNTGAQWSETAPGQGMFTLEYFKAPVQVSYPELVAYRAPSEPLPLPLQALLLYHFTASDGAPLVGKWVSFADLPDGRMYAQAFQGYAGDKLTRAFGNQIEPFKQACLSAGGSPVEVGDASFSFTALPRVPLLVTYWLGEDEFPSSCKILFDASARSHLPIDVCAILGSMLVSRILKAARGEARPAGQ